MQLQNRQLGWTLGWAPLRLLAWTLVLLSPMVASPVAATATYLSTVDIECYTDRTTVSGPVPFQSESCAAFGTTAAANVDSDVGVIRSHATITRISGSGTGGTSQGVARFQDSFLVTALDSSSSSVLSGFLTVIVDVDAPVTLPQTQGSGSTFFGSILWNFDVGSESEDGRTLLNVGSGTTGGRFEFDIPWSAGVPIDILFFANLDIHISTLGTATGTGDFIISWGGISGVTDGGGVSVQSFTALSTAGFNYAAAVPEPASGILLGLGLVAAVRGRSRAASRSALAGR